MGKLDQDDRPAPTPAHSARIRARPHGAPPRGAGALHFYMYRYPFPLRCVFRFGVGGRGAGFWAEFCFVQLLVAVPLGRVHWSWWGVLKARCLVPC